MKHVENVYINYDPFEGDRDSGIRCKKVKLVKTRKEHDCISFDHKEQHEIAKGEMARVETAIVDGSWGSYYMCTDCIDKWLNLTGVL
jgi:hypothetical protein